MMQNFINIMVRNYQEIPNVYGNFVMWENGDKFVIIHFADIVRYSDGHSTGHFKFDGTAESIPEELTDMIFKVNGFLEN